MEKGEDLQRIRKKLEKSDRIQWQALTDPEKEAVAEKYYNLRGIKALGVASILVV